MRYIIALSMGILALTVFNTRTVQAAYDDDNFVFDKTPDHPAISLTEERSLPLSFDLSSQSAFKLNMKPQTTSRVADDLNLERNRDWFFGLGFQYKFD